MTSYFFQIILDEAKFFFIFNVSSLQPLSIMIHSF